MTARFEYRLSTVEEMTKHAQSSLDAIDRDGAKRLTDRQRRVVVHWVVASMIDARNAAIAEQVAKLTSVLEGMKNGRL